MSGTRALLLYTRLEVPEDLARDVLEGDVTARLHALNVLRESMDFDLGEVLSLSEERGIVLQASAEVSQQLMDQIDTERCLLEEEQRVREMLLEGLRSAGERAIRVSRERRVDRRTFEVTGRLESVDIETEMQR